MGLGRWGDDSRTPPSYRHFLRGRYQNCPPFPGVPKGHPTLELNDKDRVPKGEPFAHAQVLSDLACPKGAPLGALHCRFMQGNQGDVHWELSSARHLGKPKQRPLGCPTLALGSEHRAPFGKA